MLNHNGAVLGTSTSYTTIPLYFASLLDEHHLQGLDIMTILNITENRNAMFNHVSFTGDYHMKIASYLHHNESKIQFFGHSGATISIEDGIINKVFEHFVAHIKTTIMAKHKKHNMPCRLK